MNEKETMNTQERKEQEYSDIKVSKQTAKVFNALAKWSELFSSIEAIEGMGNSLEIEFYTPMYEIRDRLDEWLVDSIIQQQTCSGTYTYKVI